MVRYAYVIPGRPGGKGINPFTKQPMSIQARPALTRYWEARSANGDVELAMGGTDMSACRWQRSFSSAAAAEQYIERLCEARIAQGFTADGEVQVLRQAPVRGDLPPGAGEGMKPDRQVDLTEPSSSGLSNADHLRAILRMDGADRIQRLCIDEKDHDLLEIVSVVAAEGPASIEELSVGSPVAYYWKYKSLGNCEPLFDLSLRKLRLYGSHFKLGYVDAPQLQELEVFAIAPRRQDVTALLRSNLPALHTLKLFLGPSNPDMLSEDDETTLEDLGPLLRAEVLTSLRSLGIQNWERATELCEALVASPLVSRIEHLDLSCSWFTDRGAAVLARAKDKLQLKSLNVERCCLTPAGVQDLRGVAEKIAVRGQRSGSGVAIVE